MKNGGFPPIKYSLESSDTSKNNDSTQTKERFFSNTPRQNINIRQLLSESAKKPVIITETIENDNLDIIESI
jgi:hypothetical protein